MMSLFSFIVNIEKGHYIQVYVEKRMINFKLIMLELEKRDLEMIQHLYFVFL